MALFQSYDIRIDMDDIGKCLENVFMEGMVRISNMKAFL